MPKEGVSGGALPAITGAILAGGLSTRLGRDKATLPLGGKPLALWVADALAPVVSELWLVTNQPLIHCSLGLPMITDLVPWQGPLGGLATALFYATTPWVLAAAADNPFLAPPLLAALVRRLTRAGPAAVVSQSSRGLEPFPGLYSVRLLSRLTRFLETDRRPRRFLEICRAQALPLEEVSRLDPEGLTLLNLNTPEDLAQAAARLAGGVKRGG